jgi:regulator of sigma E protease
MLTTIVAFLFVLSLLILAHEIGHFVAARRVGIRVVEFGIGWPPRLVSRKIGETIYSLNLLPLGGFVRMFGEFGGQEPGSFMSKRPLERSVVILAGVAMNFLIAPVLFTTAFMLGEPVYTDRILVQEVVAESPAAAAGLMADDRILTINDVPITTMAQVREQIGNVEEGTPIQLTVLRESQEKSMSIVPAYNPQIERLAIGVVLLPEHIIKRYWPWEAAWRGILRTGEMFGLIGMGIASLIRGSEEADLLGPVGIASLTGQVARSGLSQLLTFTGFLSINLAIINLFPFPGLDGARFIFTVVEMVRGRPINPKREAAINFAGIVILLTLTVLITYRDVVRLVG